MAKGDNLKDKVWDKGKPIAGKNPATHRKDSEGNEIAKSSYGKDSPKGWEIDHKTPKSKGGSDDIRNLQPLKTSANRAKGNSTRK